MQLRSRYLVLGLAAMAVLAATAFLLVRQLTPTSATEGTGPDGEMLFNVDSPPGVCDDPDRPTKCTLDPGQQFTLAVSVSSVPFDPNPDSEADPGYIGFQTLVLYDGLVYKPTDTAGEEIVWPESFLAVRDPLSPTGLEGSVAHGDASGLFAPFPLSTHVGNVVEIALTCPAEDERFNLLLLSFSELGRQPDDTVGGAVAGGAALTQLRVNKLLIGDPLVEEVVPPKPVGRQPLDLDGDGELDTWEFLGEMLLIEYAIGARLEINCGEPPTPTPTEGPTPTVTPTPTEGPTPEPTPTGGPAPTVTPTPPEALPTETPTPTSAATPGGPADSGDVNCSGATDSIDAALVLQMDAALIGSLSCLHVADVDGDGDVDSTDALLILQFDAGLIPSL